jgi:hypothetical protein
MCNVVFLQVCVKCMYVSACVCVGGREGGRAAGGVDVEPA